MLNRGASLPLSPKSFQGSENPNPLKSSSNNLQRSSSVFQRDESRTPQVLDKFHIELSATISNLSARNKLHQDFQGVKNKFNFPSQVFQLLVPSEELKSWKSQLNKGEEFSMLYEAKTGLSTLCTVTAKEYGAFQKLFSANFESFISNQEVVEESDYLWVSVRIQDAKKDLSALQVEGDRIDQQLDALEKSLSAFPSSKAKTEMTKEITLRRKEITTMLSHLKDQQSQLEALSQKVQGAKVSLQDSKDQPLNPLSPLIWGNSGKSVYPKLLSPSSQHPEELEDSSPQVIDSSRLEGDEKPIEDESFISPDPLPSKIQLLQTGKEGEQSQQFSLQFSHRNEGSEEHSLQAMPWLTPQQGPLQESEVSAFSQDHEFPDLELSQQKMSLEIIPEDSLPSKIQNGKTLQESSITQHLSQFSSDSVSSRQHSEYSWIMQSNSKDSLLDESILKRVFEQEEQDVSTTISSFSLEDSQQQQEDESLFLENQNTDLEPSKSVSQFSDAFIQEQSQDAHRMKKPYSNYLQIPQSSKIYRKQQQEVKPRLVEVEGNGNDELSESSLLFGDYGHKTPNIPLPPAKSEQKQKGLKLEVNPNDQNDEDDDESLYQNISTVDSIERRNSSSISADQQNRMQKFMINQNPVAVHHSDEVINNQIENENLDAEDDPEDELLFQPMPSQEDSAPIFTKKPSVSASHLEEGFQIEGHQGVLVTPDDTLLQLKHDGQVINIQPGSQDDSLGQSEDAEDVEAEELYVQNSVFTRVDQSAIESKDIAS